MTFMRDLRKFVAALLVLLAGGGVCFAQKVEPTSTWPYIYKDFRNGTVRVSGGELVSAAMMNISLDGKIHYVNEKDQKVMSADMLDVLTARLGDDEYVNCGGRMMKVLAENGKGTVVCGYSLNTEEMSKTDIGYGISSSTASTQKLSSLSGDASSLVNLPLSTLMEGRTGGERLPVLRSLFFRVGSSMVPATKKGVTEAWFVDKDTAKAFLKANKIKWNDEASLVKVLDFLSEQNNK